MRLSDLVDLYGDKDPIIALEDSDGVPIDPDDIDEGLIYLAQGPYPYICLRLIDPELVSDSPSPSEEGRS
jgi:hypothetical protein